MKRTNIENNNIIKEKGTWVTNKVQIVQDTWYSQYEKVVPVYEYQNTLYLCDAELKSSEIEINIV